MEIMVNMGSYGLLWAILVIMVIMGNAGVRSSSQGGGRGTHQLQLSG